ncbi:MAG: LysM peptidoglycan-binding domain-containing protein [Muribaculaceae bacterium]|nr:LysM peptidoglycan-binding domain-containing protein [Muribaculaceae bacterium]
MRKAIIALLIAIFCTLFSALAENISDLPTTEHDGKLCHYLQVQPKETIYSITHRFNITAEQLQAWNPEVAEGLKAYAILYFPADDVRKAEEVVTYIVQPKETVYGLSKRFGITPEELIAQNPDVANGLKIGQELKIRQAPEKSTPADYAVKVPDVSEQPVVAAEQQPATTKQAERSSLNIAVMLPFMLHNNAPGKAALRHTEFFKGFLLGIDTLNTRRGTKPVKLYAYDTAGSVDTIKALFKKHPELQNADLIIAPDSEEQLAVVATFGKEHSIPVLNEFVVKDDAYLTNPYVMQGNIPQQQMFENAIEEMLKRFPNHTPVVLNRQGSPNERAEFVAILKEKVAKNNKTLVEINFEEKLTEDKLADLTSGKHIFVSTSGRQAEVNKILPALVALKEKAPDPDNVLVVGYPEWITYRGETLTNMQAANTYVFTRFFNEADDVSTKLTEDAFKRNFGSGMEQVMPRQGLMGYDTAMYVVRALDKGLDQYSYSGLQNGFDFVRQPDGGWLNTALYLVNYRPSGMIDRSLIK